MDIDASGAWTYTADNSLEAMQSLGADEDLTDTITVLSADGTEQDITITIDGSNDAPEVMSAVQALMSEDGSEFTLDLLGGVADTDTNDALSVDVASVALSSGDDSGITVNSNGTLSITPDAYTSLPAGTEEVVTYSYDVVDSEGARVQQTASVTITGANDAPTIGGVAVGAITEDQNVVDGNLVAAGLSITDADTGEAAFQAGTVSGTYGSLDIDASGAWTYTADNSLEAIQSLGADEDLTDTITVLSADGTSQQIDITINGADDFSTGNAIDGYIEGAMIFGDENGNRQWDPGEARAITGTDGAYTLTDAEGRLVLEGGGDAIDAATGLTFKGILEAPEGSVGTPLTTIMSKLIDGGIVSDPAEAETMVKSALGITSDVDLTAFDPVAAAVSDNPSVATAGIEIASKGVAVQNLVVQAAAAVKAAGDLGWGASTSNVYKSLASFVDGLSGAELMPDANSDAQNISVLKGLIEGAAQVAGLTDADLAEVEAASDAVATVMYESNAVLESAVSDSAEPVSALIKMAEAAVVAQDQSADAISAAVNAVEADASDTSLISSLVSSYSGASLGRHLMTLISATSQDRWLMTHLLLKTTP